MQDFNPDTAALNVARYRRHRVAELWARFERLAAAAGLAYADPATDEKRLRLVALTVTAGQLPDWYEANAIDTGILEGYSRKIADYRPRPAGNPTRHPPGSRKKLRTLALRFASGVDLFHPDDVVECPNC